MLIDEKTNVQLYAVAVCLPVLCGGLLWLTAIHYEASEAKTETLRLRAENIGMREMIIDIRERLIRIEDKLTK